MPFTERPLLNEFKNRRLTLRNALKNRGISIALLTHQPDVYYFSGTAQNAYLIVSCYDESILFVRKFGPRARAESDIRDVRFFRSMSDIASSLKESWISASHCLHAGIEMDVIPLKLFQRFEALFPQFEWQDVSEDVRWIRSSKSEYELHQIRKACALLDRVFDQIGSWLRPGITELELAARIEGKMRAWGHQGHLAMRAYNSSIHYGNVLFGESGAVRGAFDGPTCGPGLYNAVPKGAGWRELTAGDPVFIDLVAGIEGYLADATRVYCLGALSDQLWEAHECCIEIQNTVAAGVFPGTASDIPYKIALNKALEMGLEHSFMGPDFDRAGFVGHGIGLEIDEYPVLAPRMSQPIPRDSVIAIEPKAVFPGIGAVGIENTWHVKNTGAVRLTDYPDTCHCVSF